MFIKKGLTSSYSLYMALSRAWQIGADIDFTNIISDIDKFRNTFDQIQRHSQL